MSNKKSAKDLAWDRERAKYKHQIHELREQCKLLTAEIEEVNALIEDAEKVNNDLRKDIEQLIQMNGIPAEELRRFLQEEHEKVKRDEEGKAAVEALLKLHSGFF